MGNKKLRRAFTIEQMFAATFLGEFHTRFFCERYCTLKCERYCTLKVAFQDRFVPINAPLPLARQMLR